ncbi:TolC family outer membrane protein [uncultured Thalassolituus sp.]|uniref:TolC family outer membrane protein n=1 Tax=uncultured Thalassolituus sp. TaxID=285273 RepID=UPI0026392B25|nr:TolC family outer membrane protein [uncultured Thalassolituus sp.]
MKKLLTLTSALLLPGAVFAADLSSIYNMAASSDPEIEAARAAREASSYNVMIARGALLPQAQVSYTHTHLEYEIKDSALDIPEYDLGSLEVSAGMSIFDLNKWYSYKAARSGNDNGNFELQMSEQQLLMRTAEAYFNALRAEDNLSTANAELKAVQRALEQTKQRYDVGLIAITEVHEAQAAYDLSYASLLGQRANREVQYEILAQLTGEKISGVSALKSSVAMSDPQPQDAEEWVASGLEKFPGLLMVQSQVEAARLQRNATRSQHMPTVELFASYTDGDQAYGFEDPLDASATSYGVKVTVPLLAGGSLYAASKQAALNYASADYQLEKTRRDVKQNIRSLYLQVRTDVLNINARSQAIRSARSALDATQTGYKVGTRNIVEVLDAQKKVYQAERDYANARYDYILNLLSLKFYAGTLNEADIEMLNGWLES